MGDTSGTARTAAAAARSALWKSKTITTGLLPGYLRKHRRAVQREDHADEHRDLLRQPTGELWIADHDSGRRPDVSDEDMDHLAQFQEGSEWIQWDLQAGRRRNEACRHITVVAGLRWLMASGPAFAQGGVRRPPRRRVEPSPTSRDRGPIGYMRIDRTRAGPHIGDYSGLPINDEARAYADLYQVSMQNMPERQCIMAHLYTSSWARRICASNRTSIRFPGPSSPCT